MMDKTIVTVVPVLAVTEAASKLLIILSVKVPTGSESTIVCVALAMYENTGELSMGNRQIREKPIPQIIESGTDR